MTPPVAQFVYDPEADRYWPANKNAARACLVLNKMAVPPQDLLAVRSQGYRTLLTNGTEIGWVEMTA